MKAIINTSEHTDIDINDVFKEDKEKEKKLEEFNKYFNINNTNPKYLGIHQDNEKNLKSYYFIGYRWFSEDKNEYIRVSPKIYKNRRADFLEILLECFKDPVVSKKIDDSYEIFFHEKWIEIEDKQDEITLLLILHFLKIVENITKKGLKKGFIKINENLTSKIKGKILINQTIKHNHIKNRIDKTVCHHQIFTINCLENQILKTALVQCSKNLYGFNEKKDVSKLLKQNLSSFELVDTKEVFDSDFIKIKYSPFYKDYKEAIKLAKMIFKRFGFSLNASSQKNNYKIPPFNIDMPELFERFVEVKVRKQYQGLIDGNRDIRDKKIAFSMRPDFLLPSKKMIIDAKYKYWFEENNEDDKFKDDYQQLSLYGREKKIRESIKLSNNEEANNEEAELVFIYPSISMKDEKKIFDSFKKYESILFNKIYRIPIQIPFTESS